MGDVFALCGASKGYFKANPIPYATWIFWLHDHAETLRISRTATDPFPTEMAA